MLSLSTLTSFESPFSGISPLQFLALIFGNVENSRRITILIEWSTRIFAFIRRLSPVDRITATFMALERPVKRPRALAITGGCLENRFAETLFHYDNDPFHGLVRRYKARVSSEAVLSGTMYASRRRSPKRMRSEEGGSDFFRGHGEIARALGVSASRYTMKQRERKGKREREKGKERMRGIGREEAHKFSRVNPPRYMCS